jgi:branched-subunit amino acid transport protein
MFTVSIARLCVSSKILMVFSNKSAFLTLITVQFSSQERSGCSAPHTHSLICYAITFNIQPLRSLQKKYELSFRKTSILSFHFFSPFQALILSEIILCISRTKAPWEQRLTLSMVPPLIISVWHRKRIFNLTDKQINKQHVFGFPCSKSQVGG